MDLWNEYEGRSIDGLFPLERLIRPEGRSAFFSTNTSGVSTVIRLIESHFDEDEILARWAGVADLHQPNLLKLTRFGQSMMDETSLVYVVLEPTEADLSQILSERPLTLAETRQVGASLIPALQALHASGFIHEHIQPANVLAVGELVKLRSDCIREAPQGAEGDARRAGDVQNLATLLLQALTQERSHSAIPPSRPLPAPFGEIIANGISGTWGLAQMAAALEATSPQPQKAMESHLPSVPPASIAQDIHRRPATTTSQPQVAAAKDQFLRNATVRAPHPLPEPVESRIRIPMHHQADPWPRWLPLLAIAVVGLVLFAAYTMLYRHKTSAPDATQPAGLETNHPPSSAASPLPLPTPETSREAPAATTGTRGPWRVVAYTYNRQDQAAAKAHALEQRYPELHAAVFAPTGHAPFLVTIGGALSREAAFNLRDRMRRSGLPRDLYARNYTSKAR